MALNWFEAGIVRRSEGHNVIARAAYNARERLVDERTNAVYDYRHLGEVEWKGILNPEHAPDWVTERERLWDAVELKEDRSTRPDDARLARDFKIALPSELTAEQRLALTQEFGEEMSRKGMIVDIAIHAPHAHNDDRNYHAHMLLTTREIGPDGFGNKVRQWNHKEEFHRWMERWSEIGADHLERAGFKQEAARFRDGHLSRRERARRAHERGDKAHFELLLSEPEKHRGPAASRMEREGKQTRQGDNNREIRERNRVRGIPREIRKAYYLSVDAAAFAAALGKNDMMLARMTDKDIANKDWEFACGRYVPHYDIGNYVVVTERGHEYRLGPMTMGDSARGIAEFMKSYVGRNFLSLEDAQAEMKRRSLVPKVDRDKVIQKLTQTSVVKPVAIANLPQPEQEQYAHEDRLLGTVEKTFTQPKDHPREALPYGADAPQVRGDGKKVWWAYNSVKSPEDFQQSLEGRGFILARVTAEDAGHSKTQHWAAMRLGRYHPILREGEYLAVSETGKIYRFNDQSLGHELREIKAFMGKLDNKPLPSLREAQNAVQEKRQKEISANMKERTGPNDLPDRGPGSIRRTLRTAAGVAGPVFEFLSNGFESLFGRTISREEKTLAEVTQHEAQKATERAKQRRGEYDRGR